MTTAYVLIAGYSDGSVQFTDVIAVLTDKQTAERLLELVKATDPSRTVLIKTAPLDAFR